MKRLSFFIAPVLFASVLGGCSLLKKKSADDSLDASTVTVGGTGAKNEKDVLRYGDEEALDEVAVIGKDGAKVRNFPNNGPEIATLPKGTVVKKMAKRFSTAVLVMFDDPVAGDGSKLMGWVVPNVFDVAAPKPVWVPPKIVDAGVKTDAGGATATDAGGAAKPDAGGGVADAVAERMPAVAEEAVASRSPHVARSRARRSEESAPRVGRSHLLLPATACAAWFARRTQNAPRSRASRSASRPAH